MKSLLLISFLFISLASRAQNLARLHDSDVPNHYFDFSLKLVKETPGFSPPVAARAFGFMGLALYESVVEGMPENKSLDGLLYEFTNGVQVQPGAIYHWPTVANNAMGLIVDSLFRTASLPNKDSLHAIKDFYNTLFAGQISAQAFNDSKAYGEAIATSVFDYSRTDGGHNSFAENFPPSYIPPSGPDLWVPFGNQVCLQPYWGSHRPFIEEDTIEAISTPAPAFSTTPGSEFYNNAFEVYNTVNNLTADQMDIALYWADGGGTVTPGGHSISILKDILDSEERDLEFAAIAYAKLGIAISDAFLACWKTKFLYNLCRPVTYIRMHIDSTWLPFISTPPFPEYPSGHSSQSGAMATVLTDIFGQDYDFVDMTHEANFGARQFTSFDEAAEEAAVSRLYGGIHFPFGNMAGLTLGSIVGTNVNELFEQSTVGIENPFFASKLKLYPNPASTMLTIEIDPSLTGNDYEVIDLYGRVVENGKLADTHTTLNVENFTPGNYILRTGGDISPVIVNRN